MQFSGVRIFKFKTSNLYFTKDGLDFWNFETETDLVNVSYVLIMWFCDLLVGKWWWLLHSCGYLIQATHPIVHTIHRTAFLQHFFIVKWTINLFQWRYLTSILFVLSGTDAFTILTREIAEKAKPSARYTPTGKGLAAWKITS